MFSIRYSCWILIEVEFSLQIFGKISNIKFHQNPSSGSPIVPSGQTEKELTVAFSNFANAPKIISVL
jgi:hypothetical protein